MREKASGATRPTAASDAVGVFDSGQGGLSIFRELIAIAPAENIVYCSDGGRMPYGPRPLAEVRRLCENVARRLLAVPVKIVVIACNAASAASLKQLREMFPGIPFVGMEPAVKPAATVSRSGKVGVLATEATLQGELFENVVARFASKVEVLRQPCPGLAEFIEKRSGDAAGLEKLVEKFVRPLVEAGADNLVLGCSHYPLIKDTIRKAAGEGVAIIDPSPAIARRTRQLLAEKGLLADRERGTHRFYTSGEPDLLAEAVKRVLGVDAKVEPGTW
ncbi:MAG: glutamate racemase [Planctomycetota bacterium]|nr:glutamate racemase [Planctomycetota bacterium]